MVQAALYELVFILKEPSNRNCERGDRFRKQREEQDSSAAQGNLQVHVEDSLVLHSSQHGEPRKSKIPVSSFLPSAQSAVISYSPQLECFYSD